jgi:hypothetical protein
MPGFDRTGPAGMGPVTGWGRGRCTPYGRRSGRQAFGPWFGWGGRGRGRRQRNWGHGSPRRGWSGFTGSRGPYYETFSTTDDEMAILKEEAAGLKEELNAIEQRLSELEANSRKTDQ